MSDPQVTIQYVKSADGAMIAVGRRGKGSPIVVVPALIGDVVDAGRFGDGLTALGHEVISYARRGIGLSARGAFAADGQLLVDDLRAVVDAVDRDEVSILGVLVGSLEAIAVAATDDRVQRLILIDPMVEGSEWARLPAIRALRAAMAEDWQRCSRPVRARTAARGNGPCRALHNRCHNSSDRGTDTDDLVHLDGLMWLAEVRLGRGSSTGHVLTPSSRRVTAAHATL